jgi:Rieske Fe-S protein
MNNDDYGKNLSTEKLSSSSDPRFTPDKSVIVPTAGAPRQYKRGDLVLVLDALAWLGCDEIGFYAIDALCPHLGCLLRRSGEGFLCAAHCSHFDLSGVCDRGPARTNLRYLVVDLDKQGQLIIYRDKRATPTDRFIA